MGEGCAIGLELWTGERYRSIAKLNLDSILEQNIEEQAKKLVILYDEIYKYDRICNKATTMGQYFRFINRDRQVESEIGLPFNFGMPWGKGLERLSTEELKKQFDFVIQANDWQPTDRIVAEGDYGETIDYPNTNE